MSDGQLRQLFARYLPEVHWVAIESPTTSRGIPDLNGCLKGTEIWIETKATDTWKVGGVRREQIAWLERRARALGRAYVAVRQRPGDRLWLLPALAARLLYDGARLDELPNVLVAAPGGPARWPWGEVRRGLFGK